MRGEGEGTMGASRTVRRRPLASAGVITLAAVALTLLVVAGVARRPPPGPVLATIAIGSWAGLPAIGVDEVAGRAYVAARGGGVCTCMATARIEDPYATLGDIGGLHIVVQRVPEPKTAKSRVHLDIETDDIEAEVQRLEALGARRMEQHEDWWVMQDPGGNEFCVFGPRLSADFPAGARLWDEQASDHA